VAVGLGWELSRPVSNCDESRKIMIPSLKIRVTQCINVFIKSLNCNTKSSLGCSDIIEHALVDFVS
jgi:hypothetical protein